MYANQIAEVLRKICRLEGIYSTYYIDNKNNEMVFKSFYEEARTELRIIRGFKYQDESVNRFIEKILRVKYGGNR